MLSLTLALTLSILDNDRPFGYDAEETLATRGRMDKEESTSELIVVDVKRYKRVKRALAASEERYRQLFENVPIGIYRTTPEGRFADANPAFLKMAGYASFAEIAATKINEEYARTGHDRGEFLRLMERDGEVKGLESAWRLPDGTLIHVRENAKLVRDKDGQVFFEGTVEDITQAKLAEAEEKRRRQQIEIINCTIARGSMAETLPELLEALLDCVLEPMAFDTAGIFMYNPESKKVELLARRGKPSQFDQDEACMAIDKRPFSQTLLDGQPAFLDEAQKNQPDFFEKWGWRMAASVPLISKGRVVGALNVASCQRSAFTPGERDVLETVGREAGTLVAKMQTEAALRESEKYYRTLIDTSPDIIVVMDLDGALLTVNQQFLRLGGYFYDDVIGRSGFDFVSGVNREAILQDRPRYFQGGGPSGAEYGFTCKDGSVIPIEVSTSGLSDNQGRPGGFISIARDIRERKQAEEQLRFLSSITENTSDAMIVTDTDFRITYINNVAEGFFGYSLDELRGRTPGIFNAEPEAEQIQNELYETIAGGGTHLGESLNRRKDGSTFYCEYKVMPLRDGTGRIVAYFSVQRDISERKRREAELRRSEDSFRRTFEAIPDPAYLWGRQADGRLLLREFNQAAATITRGGIKEYVGVDAEVLFAATPDFTAMIRGTMDDGQRRFAEVLYQFRSTNESRWLQVDYVRTAADTVLVITKDVSEYKQAEAQRAAALEQLRLSESKYRELVENHNDVIFSVDAVGIIEYLSPAIFAISGFTPEEVVGRNLFDFFPAAERDPYAEQMRRTAASGSSVGEYAIIMKDGSCRWIRASSRSIVADGKVVGVRGIMSDISERKEAEARLLAYQEQLRQLSSELTLVEERERRRIAGELHDQIGQNLALCKLKVAALEKDDGARKLKSELSAVRRLLEVSIQDARSLIIDLSPPVLYELGFAAALEWLTEHISEQYHVAIDFENRAPVTVLENDRQVILFQVVREMLINVGKHAQASRAKVILSLVDRELKIEVNDDGKGFDPGRAFDRPDRQGGFGLFSMRERLNYLGGRMEVRSKPGRGSQVVLSVPAPPVKAKKKKEKA